MALSLSVLDQSPISEGLRVAGAAQFARPRAARRPLATTATGSPSTTARRCWPGPSPEALIGPIAVRHRAHPGGQRRRMLPHYSPFKVAEAFSVLGRPLPGPDRSRARPRAGHRPETAHALQRDRRQPAARRLPEQLVELLAYLEDTLPRGHPFARLAKALPGLPERPSLGCSAPRRRAASGPASWACPTRSPTSSTRTGRDRARYRASSRPATAPAPRTVVAVWAIARDTDAEARAAGGQRRMAFDAAPRPADPGAAGGDRRWVSGAEGDMRRRGGRRMIVGTRHGARGHRGGGRATTGRRR